MPKLDHTDDAGSAKVSRQMIDADDPEVPESDVSPPEQSNEMHQISRREE